MNDDLFRLLGDLQNGTISAEDHARLEKLLAEYPEARKAYFAYTDLHLGLFQIHAVEAEARPLEQLRKDLERLKPRRRRLWIPLAAAAALLAIGLFSLPPSAPRPVATLVQSAGARFYGTDAPSALVAGREYALTAGRAEIAFASGVRAILQAPVAFRPLAADRLSVGFGKCSVQVPPGAEGFVLETPLARIVDRGTRFAVDVDESGETDVQVLEGKAEVAAGAATPALLEAGKGKRIATHESRDASFDAARFPLEMPDGVVRYTATSRATGGVEDLVSVDVRRGGRVVRYSVEQLIGIDVVHFKSNPKRGNFFSTVTDGADPAPARPRTSLLDRDRNLNTGVINPGGGSRPISTDPVMNEPEDPSRPNTVGLGIRFHRPVVNGPGPDVVMFEFQPVVQPEHGDPFHVGPLRFAPGLRSHTVARWDMGTYSPEAQVCAGFRLVGYAGPVASIRGFLENPLSGGVNFTVTSKILAVGIDFSDLGYRPGAEVEGLFIQDGEDGGHQVDPTFIGGLP